MNDGVQRYLDALPTERRAVLEAVRALVNAHMPPEVEEGIQYGMIGWYVPHARYPHGYHCDPKEPLPYLGLASQKGHAALHLFCAYVDDTAAAWLRAEAAARGCTIDMGKACVRFKRLDDVPLDLIGQTIARMTLERFVAAYEARLPAAIRKKRGLDGTG
jgi:hypothetical protein